MNASFNRAMSNASPSHSSTPCAGRRLVFNGKQQVALETMPIAGPKENEVVVRTAVSLMSTGTENIVFNRAFDPDTHWDHWVKYPFYPGYCGVGTVEAVGGAVTAVAPGDRVAGRFTHRSHAILAESACVPIPEAIPWEEAVWFALAKIAFHGAFAADYSLGDSVLVVGAGPIGQMSVRWANAAGAETVIALDPVERRLAMARSGGAAVTIARPVAEAREALLAENGGKLPRVVIDSTGNAEVFAAAQGLAGRFGTIVILGDTGQPTQQRLTGDVITRGLRIVGAHDGHNSERWDNASISRLFFRLAATGRFPLDGLITHRFAPEECREAYRVANEERPLTMGILFDWR